MVEENVFVLHGVLHFMKCGTLVFFCCYKPLCSPLEWFLSCNSWGYFWNFWALCCGKCDELLYHIKLFSLTVGFHGFFAIWKADDVRILLNFEAIRDPFLFGIHQFKLIFMLKRGPSDSKTKFHLFVLNNTTEWMEPSSVVFFFQPFYVVFQLGSEDTSPNFYS